MIRLFMLELGMKPGQSLAINVKGDGAALYFPGCGFTTCFSTLLAFSALNNLESCEWQR